MLIGDDVNTGDTVILVGGCGGLSRRYGDIVAERGLVLRHFEDRVPSGARRALGRVVAVFVVVSMVSHALRDRVKVLAPPDTPVVYLRTASVSALRAAVTDLAHRRAVA